MFVGLCAMSPVVWGTVSLHHNTVSPPAASCCSVEAAGGTRLRPCLVFLHHHHRHRPQQFSTQNQRFHRSQYTLPALHPDDLCASEPPPSFSHPSHSAPRNRPVLTALAAISAARLQH